MICNGKSIPVVEGDLILSEPGDEHGLASNSEGDVHPLVAMMPAGNEGNHFSRYGPYRMPLVLIFLTLRHTM